ncbi:MAG: hypothetical protein JNL79_07190 [Myxococcales bacterium]|nr:hypothetical protein [Myxococcales bacterium]
MALGTARWQERGAPLTGWLAAAACVIGSVTASAGHAAECTGPELDVEAEAKALHPGLEAKVQAHLAGSDPCARVHVLATGGKLVVIVTLKDGRTAIRRANDVDDLLDAVDALVLVPTHAVAPAAAEEPAVAPRFTPVVKDEAPKASASASVPTPRLEFAAAATAGISGAPGFAGFGLQGLAQLHVAPSLLGVVVRYEPLGGPLADTDSRGRFRTMSMSVAAVAGRRMLLGSMQLDMLAGLGLVALSQEFKAPGEKEVRSTRLDPRLVASLRLSDSGAASLRGYLGLDLTAGWPTSQEPAPGLLAFPSTSATLSLGLLWGGK